MRGLDSLERVSQSIPNLIVTGGGGGTGQTNFTVRGIPNVGTYVDGVWQVGTNGFLTEGFVDIDRIEVLRGPQGTEFGRDSTGGAIRIWTKKPSDQYNADVTATVGSYQRHDVQASVDLPITDKLLSRFTAASLNRDGYIDSLTTGASGGNIDQQIARADLLWTPTEKLTWRFNYQYDSNKSIEPRLQDAVFKGTYPQAGQAVGVPDLYEAAGAGAYNAITMTAGYPGGQVGEWQNRSNITQPNDFQTKQFSSDATWQVTDKLKLEFLTAQTDQQVYLNTDWDNSQWDLVDRRQPEPPPRVQPRRTADRRRGPREVGRRLVLLEPGQLHAQHALPGRGVRVGPVQHQHGVREPDLHVRPSRRPASAGVRHPKRLPRRVCGSERSRRSVRRAHALHPGRLGGVRRGDHQPHQEDRHDRRHASPRPERRRDSADDRARARLRRVRRSRTSGSSAICSTVLRSARCRTPSSFDKNTYRFSVQDQFTQDVMAYIGYSEGFNSGGASVYTDPSTAQRVVAPYDPQFLKNTEIGIRSDLANKHLRINATIFHTQWDDIQSLAAVFDSAGHQLPILTNQNVGSALAQGAELEMTIVPTEKWLFNVNIGYLDAHVHGDQSRARSRSTRTRRSRKRRSTPAASASSTQRA